MFHVSFFLTAVSNFPMDDAHSFACGCMREKWLENAKKIPSCIPYAIAENAVFLQPCQDKEELYSNAQHLI